MLTLRDRSPPVGLPDDATVRLVIWAFMLAQKVPWLLARKDMEQRLGYRNPLAGALAEIDRDVLCNTICGFDSMRTDGLSV